MRQAIAEPSWMKGPPRKILLATDLSARCDRALDRAALLASSWGAELVVLHALEEVDDLHTSSLGHRLPSWRRPPDAARIAEEQLRNDMMAVPASVSVMVEDGKPAEVILRAVKTQGCGLIVTGIARDETFGRFGLGATVDRLLRRSKVPVLIVKSRARAPYQNIIVATDFSGSSRHALRAATRLFPEQRLSVFHAYEAPLAGMTPDAARHEEEYRKVAADDCAKFLTTVGLPDRHKRGLKLLVENGEPGQLIRQYARDRAVDLVVLGTHGRTALLEVLIGSTAKQILSALSCDALVVREPRAAVESEAGS
jgi:nucleotide-binding universal stress UspA family protein